MRRYKLITTTALAAVAALVIPLTPAGAVGAGVATAVFQGDVTLNPFPGTGTANFDGNVLAATATGVVNTTPVAAVEASGSVDADVNYQEITCALGLASGTATVNTPSASATADLNWIRLGAVAVAALTNANVDVAPGRMIEAPTGVGAAVAAFTTDDPVAACTTTGSVTAHVTGAAVLAGADVL